MQQCLIFNGSGQPVGVVGTINTDDREFGWKDEFPTVAEASPEIKESVRKKWPHLFK